MEEKVTAVNTERKNRLMRLFKDNNSVLILVIMLFVAFVFVDSYANGFYNVIKYTAMYGPVCLGLALVMICGNIDLSAGFQAGLAGVTTVICFNLVYNATGSTMLSFVVSIVGCLLTGLVTGIINGFFVAKIGVYFLFSCILAFFAYQGVVFFLDKSLFAPADNTLIKLLHNTKLFGLKWFSPSLIVFVLILVVVFLWMYKTKFGNRLHVVGDNPEAAAFAGISVQNTVWVSYILCGLLSAVTGFIMVSNAGFALYTQGNSLATLTISCCVIGGIKMTGGKGTAVHVLLGVLIMRTISQMMTAMFLTTAWVSLITGLLLIAVLIIDRFTSVKSVD